MDERFQQVLTDPRFRTLKKQEKKIKVDKRFHGMFTERKFDTNVAVDKRGRKDVPTLKDDLKKFYDVSSESEDASEEEKEEKEEDGEDEEENSDEAPEESTVLLKKTAPDARGLDSDVDESSDSSSDDEDSEREVEGPEFDHKWGEFNADVPRSDNVSKRLAVCNVDWDRIKAVDLYVLMDSFRPSNGAIISVKIYPSEFGRQRMEEEITKGPPELVEVTLSDKDEDPYSHAKANTVSDELEFDSPYLTEKLRQYQINRLKYYYAVVLCDTAETAQVLYDQLDGMEYESSATILDLRFIPDDVSFTDETPSSECNHLPDPTSYKPPLFITSALQQSKVHLTWDETDPRRKQALSKVFESKEKIDDDLDAYLASETSEDEDVPVVCDDVDDDDSQDKLDKYKNLLKSLEEAEEESKPDVDMEIKWEPSLKSIAKTIVDEKTKQEGLSAFELDYLKKSKARKNRKNKQESDDEEDDKEGEQALDLIVMDDIPQDREEKLEKESKRKKNKSKMSSAKRKLTEKNDDFEVDTEDPRFASVYSSQAFSIDQSNSNFKSTKGMEKLLNYKFSKKSKTMETETKKSGKDLLDLVETVRSKSKHFTRDRSAKL